MPVKLKCDYCKKDIIKSPSKVTNTNFCSGECREDYKREYIGFNNCTVCGVRYKRYAPIQKYCSSECRKLAVARKKEASKTARVCLICGNTFYRLPYKTARYCSRSCASKSKGVKKPTKIMMHGTPTNEIITKHPELLKTRVCKNHGCLSELSPAYIGLYCVDCISSSKKIRAKHKRYVRVVESGVIKNPGVGSGGSQWGTDNSQYLENPKHNLDLVVRNYRTLYKNAHGKISCEVCGSLNGVAVHHKDGDRGNYSTSNLVALCASEHRNLHTETRLFGEDTVKYLSHFDEFIAKLKSRNEAGKPCGG